MGWPTDAFLYLRQIVTPKGRPQPGGNLLYTKSDNNLYLLNADGTERLVGGGGTGNVNSVVAGTQISVDSTDPTAPVVSTTGLVASVTAGTNVTVDNTDPLNPIVSAASVTVPADLPVIDVVMDHGAAVDGTTDDTAAWQAALDQAGSLGGARIISSISGVSIIAGALQDTSGANAQLILPSIDAVDSEQISIYIEGAVQSPTGFSVIGATPVPDNHLILKSTLTSGSGGALLGGYGPAGTFDNFTFVHLTLRNVAFRMPSNPTHTALDLRHVTQLDIDGVVIDTGSYYVDGLTQPSTSSSYGLRCPTLNNGAHTRLGVVNVVGFYSGYEFNEHTNGFQVNAWGCRRAFVFTSAYHASKFQRLMGVHCTTVLLFTGGAHYLDIDQLNIEHVSTGWQQTTYDIDDASNYGHGFIRWHVVLGNVGVDSTFTVNGGSNLQTSQLGTTIGASSYTLTVQDENSNVSTSVTQIDFQGAGVTTTSGTGEVVVTIPGAAAGAGELLMQDGISGPPVPLTTEDGTDWLYQG